MYYWHLKQFKMENLAAITIFSHQYILLNSNHVLLQKVLRNKCCSRNHTRLLEQWSGFFYTSWRPMKIDTKPVSGCSHMHWNIKPSVLGHHARTPALISKGEHHCEYNSLFSALTQGQKLTQNQKEQHLYCNTALKQNHMSSMLTLESALICELIFAQRNTWKQMQMQSEWSKLKGCAGDMPFIQRSNLLCIWWYIQVFKTKHLERYPMVNAPVRIFLTIFSFWMSLTVFKIISKVELPDRGHLNSLMRLWKR